MAIILAPTVQQELLRAVGDRAAKPSASTVVAKTITNIILRFS